MGIKWEGSLAHGVLGVVGAGVACTEQGEAALPALAAAPGADGSVRGRAHTGARGCLRRQNALGARTWF